MKAYRIRNSKGMYSTGGMEPLWQLRGKLWKNKQALTLHFSMLRQDYPRPLPWPYKGCVVEEFELVKANEFPVEEWGVKVNK